MGEKLQHTFGRTCPRTGSIDSQKRSSWQHKTRPTATQPSSQLLTTQKRWPASSSVRCVRTRARRLDSLMRRARFGEVINMNDFAIYETQLQRQRRFPSPGRINCVEDAAWACRDMALLDREHLVRLDLDTRNNIIGRETVHIGTSDTTIISAKDILRGAILNGAAKIIIAHNHPSGDPSPSQEDIAATEKMTAAGQTIGLPLVDALIIGHDGHYYSCERRCGGQMQNISQSGKQSKQSSLLSYRFK